MTRTPTQFSLPAITSVVLSALLSLQALPGHANDLGRYIDLAVQLLDDAIARETVFGSGTVPDYARSLRRRFLDAGFAEDAVQLVPLNDTMSLLVRYAGDNSSGRRPILSIVNADRK